MNIHSTPLHPTRIIVVTHEFGHLAARRFGVTVHEFSVGFGPVIGKMERKGVHTYARFLGRVCQDRRNGQARKANPKAVWAFFGVLCSGEYW